MFGKLCVATAVVVALAMSAPSAAKAGCFGGSVVQPGYGVNVNGLYGVNSLGYGANAFGVGYGANAFAARAYGVNSLGYPLLLNQHSLYLNNKLLNLRLKSRAFRARAFRARVLRR